MYTCLLEQVNLHKKNGHHKTFLPFLYDFHYLNFLRLSRKKGIPDMNFLHASFAHCCQDKQTFSFVFFPHLMRVQLFGIPV